MRQVRSKIKVVLCPLISVEFCITNSNKTLLSTSSLPTPWWSSEQKTRTLDGEKLAVVSWKCSSTFNTPDPDFLGESWNSSRSPTSLLSRHGSLRLLVVSEIEDVLRVEKRQCITRRRRWTQFPKKPSGRPISWKGLIFRQTSQLKFSVVIVNRS